MSPSPIIAIMVHAPEWEEGFSWYQRAFPESNVTSAQSQDWRHLEYDGVSIEIVNADEKVPPGAAGSIVYWGANEFDERLAYLLSIGATLFRGPMEIEGNVRICQVMDPFGNAFGIREQEEAGRPDPDALAGLPAIVSQSSRQIDDRPKEINQGDIYWIQPQESTGIELGSYRHPYVVVQDDLFNHSRIETVVVCALTSNIRLANDPGNVLLDIDEADLPKQSAVVVSKISSVPKAQLGEYVGSLSKSRIDQILAGLRFLQLSYFAR